MALANLLLGWYFSDLLELFLFKFSIMLRKIFYTLIVIFSFGSFSCDGNDGIETEIKTEPSDEDKLVETEYRENHEFVYKEIDGFDLDMKVIYPAEFATDSKAPAIMFYHGGGWRNGAKEAFERQANYFASRGLISFLVEYRIETEHGTSPFEAVKDAKSAIRYVRKNAAEFGVDADNILASGGSAGGHLAVSISVLDQINEDGESLEISSKPQALFLFNPVLDTSKRGFGYPRVGGEEHYREISPIMHLSSETPPTLIMVGTEDKVLPQYIAEEYRDLLTSLNVRCDLVLYEGQEHSFFNYRNRNPYFFETLIEADKFLVSLGYLQGENSVMEFFEE